MAQDYHGVQSNKFELIDIGVNLAHESFAMDREAVIASATEVGVTQMIITGSSLASNAEAIALAASDAGHLFATAGVHPHHAVELTTDAVAELRRAAEQPQVVAVGECGLDYFRDLAPRDQQRRAFASQLAIAANVGKPVFLHQRDAHADFLALVREYRRSLVGGVAHCFTGDRDQLEAYLDLNLAIGITGWICDERRGHHLKTLVPQIPADRLLLETDAPYLLPRDLTPRPKTRRNEPKYLPHIAHAIAAARQQPVAELAASSTAVARKLFRLTAV